MKKLFVFTILVLALVLGVSTIAAQGQNGTDAPGVWGSSINVQNIGTGAATFTIQFYNPDGSLEYTYTPSSTLAQGDSLSIYVPALSSLASGQYSAVVSSDQPMLASVNTASTTSTTSPWTAFAYDGFDSTQSGTTLYFPGNYKNYYNFYSELVIQNTGSTAATITGKFMKADGTVIASGVNMGTIQPNSAQTYPMSAFTQLPSGDGVGIFGAVITSSGQPLVGVANLWRTQPTAGTASYSGFTGGSSNLYAPALYKNYYGFGSALTVQNVGTGTAAGTITYSNGTTDTFSLVEGAAKEFYQPANALLPTGNASGVFAASIATTSGQVVGLVSLSIPSGSDGSFASYNVPDTASTSVNIPNINSDYYGFFSAVTVQNTDTTLTTDITITYADNTFRTFTNIPPQGVVNILHLNSAGDILPNRTATSATVTSSNGVNLVAVTQHNTANGVSGYDPSKKPSDFLLAVTGVSN